MDDHKLSSLLQNQIAIPEKLLINYAKIGLDEQDVMILLQLHRFLQRGIDFPTPGEIANTLTIDETECSAKLRDLFQRNMIDIIEYKNEQGKISEAYSLEPLWQRLLGKEKDVEEKTRQEEGNLFVLFEQEFGRPLSPFEIETISVWLDDDGLKPALIVSALREAVLMGKLNFTYIDRILREWKRKGITSVEQAKEATDNFRKTKTVKKYKPEKRDRSIYFNWLDGDGGA
ncbi:MAG TPA: DnaD domain-containing protein [Pseudogracilibacillus sp.]|nr:DnaD domain-containing protein [Pseudogracilibacillus sp.]